jgi:hypothetical protein
MVSERAMMGGVGRVWCVGLGLEWCWCVDGLWLHITEVPELEVIFDWARGIWVSPELRLRLECGDGRKILDVVLGKKSSSDVKIRGFKKLEKRAKLAPGSRPLPFSKIDILPPFQRIWEVSQSSNRSLPIQQTSGLCYVLQKKRGTNHLHWYIILSGREIHNPLYFKSQPFQIAHPANTWGFSGEQMV